MCKTCGDLNHEEATSLIGRRNFLASGAGLLAAAPLASAALTSGALAQETAGENLTEAHSTDSCGVTDASGNVHHMTIERRAAGPRDIVIEVMYSGICYSEIHTIVGDWGPVRAPVVPGHEIVGRVVGIGTDVTRFKVGEMAGVGCMVDSCGTCEHCLGGEEQYCQNGATWTYGSPADVPGGVTMGGWSRSIVVTEKFVIRMPQGGDHAARAPLLCAGVTTFSPLRHWKVEPGMRVGVVGIGGLGHLAVKIASSMRADVTMFTSSEGKLADAEALAGCGRARSRPTRWRRKGRHRCSADLLERSHHCALGARS